MSVSNVNQSTLENYAKQVGKVSEWMPNIRNIVSNTNKVALPFITLLALSQLPKVDGGPLEYSACILGCTILTGPAAITCFNLCLPLLFLPSP